MASRKKYEFLLAPVLIPKKRVHATVLSIALALCSLCANAQPADPAISDICPNYSEVMSNFPPFEVMRRGITTGEVTVTFTVTADDQTTDISTVGASGYFFESWAITIVKRLHCRSGGREQRLSVPFSWRLYEYTASPEDIPPQNEHNVLPLIAELRVAPETFTLKVGDGIVVDSLKVLAFDRDGKLLGRLRDFDRDAQPNEVLTMRGTGFAQASGAGDGFLELSAPKSTWKSLVGNSQPPSVRVRVLVSK